MTVQTYTIELKMNVDDTKHEAMTQVMAQYARDFLATAMLLADGRGAMIAARSTDSFYDTKEIETLIPSDTIVDPNNPVR
jgi:hypothetical protein